MSNQTVFNVVEYGADPTGVLSSQWAFQRAIDLARGISNGTPYGNLQCAGTVIIPKGKYTGIKSLDCTNCVGMMIQGFGWGTSIYADSQAESLPIFDFSGSAYITVRDINIFSMTTAGAKPTIVPQAAILLSDSQSSPYLSNKNSFTDVNIYGWYTSASLAIYRSTNNSFYSCSVTNDVTIAPALYIGTNNLRGLVSGFQALNAPGFVANENAFFGCEFHGAKTGAAQFAAINFDGANTVSLYGGVVDASGSGQPMVYFSQPGKGFLFSGVKFYTESGQVPGFVFYSDIRVSNLTCMAAIKDEPLATIPTIYGAGPWPKIQLNGF